MIRGRSRPWQPPARQAGVRREHGYLCARTTGRLGCRPGGHADAGGAGRSCPIWVRLAFPLGECCPDAPVRALRGGSFRTVRPPPRSVGLGRPAALRGMARGRCHPRRDRAAQGSGRGHAAGRARLSRDVPARGGPRLADLCLLGLVFCPGRGRVRLRLLVPGARRGREGVRWRADHAQRGRAQHRGRRCGRRVAGLTTEPAEAAAAEIKRSEERYRSLVQGGAQVVWVAAPDGAMKDDSPEWRWITGQSEQEYTGFGWLESIHPEDRERVERGWRECVRTGKLFDDRYRIATKGGSYRHYDVRAVPIERDGKIVEWVGASSDVTSQREAEEMRGRRTTPLSHDAPRRV